MGLSTHVLDTMHGCPAAGMAVELYTTSGGDSRRWSSASRSTRDGRSPDGPLYDSGSLKKGTYRLVFDVAGYFRARGVALPEPSFLGKVSAGLRRGPPGPALPRAAAGEPVELLDLSGLVSRPWPVNPGTSCSGHPLCRRPGQPGMTVQSWPSVSVSSWKRPLLCHSQVSV